jgi:hypothetical protein
LRRAAVSVPTNIVEGCARNSERGYPRLGILRSAEEEPLVGRYDDLIRGLQKLLSVLRHPKPGA